MSNNKPKFKIDTKEVLHVITPEEPDLSENMAAEFVKELENYLKQPVKNLVINFTHITSMDKVFGMKLAGIQQSFYQKNVSMVFCGFSTEVEETLKKNGVLEKLNYTPTESEAIDIVQMDEIERELL